MLKSKVLKATQYSNALSIELEDRAIKTSEGCCILHTSGNAIICSISRDGDVYVRQISNGAISKQAPINELSDLENLFELDLADVIVNIDISTTTLEFKQWATAG